VELEGPPQRSIDGRGTGVFETRLCLDNYLRCTWKTAAGKARTGHMVFPTARDPPHSHSNKKKSLRKSFFLIAKRAAIQSKTVTAISS